MTNHKGSFSPIHGDKRTSTRLRSKNMEETYLVNKKNSESFIYTDSKRKQKEMEKSTIGGF